LFDEETDMLAAFTSSPLNDCGFFFLLAKWL